ncbi:MAG: hypothetical protein MI863_19095 [Desulfobacterales bacterium]|nr:hypothetical protein [Desulfobacterales bacterium]
MKKFIVALAVSAMLMTGSAMAADWNFYGSARISTFYVDDEGIGTNTTDTSSYEQALQGNSRIGATVKVSDELTGGFEYGTGVNVRKLYGEWNFGAGSLLVGQTYTPLNWFYSNQVYGTDNDMLAQGGVYSGRQGMLRLKFGTFEIAAVTPNEETTNVNGGNGTTEVDFPAIEAKYTFNFDSGKIQIAGGYNAYELTDGGVTYDVDSYVVALGGTINFGAFYLGSNVWVGENPGNLMAVSVDGDNAWDDGFASITGGQLYDNEAYGFILVGAYTVNDMFKLEAGYGYANTELDQAGAQEDEVATYYLQSVITLAPGVMVIPEIGMIDGEESGDIERTYFGAKWQINF